MEEAVWVRARPDFGPLQSCIVASLNAGLLCTALITNSDLGDIKFFFYWQIG